MKSGQISPADTLRPACSGRQSPQRDSSPASITPARTSSKKFPLRSWGRSTSSSWAKSSASPPAPGQDRGKTRSRKAGGVYYTPTYIVDYIVQNTVGKLLEGKTPDQAANPKFARSRLRLRLLPAGRLPILARLAFALVLRARAGEVGQGQKPALSRRQGGEWKLTTAEKKRILLNNIYGVDIDPQAVEVTKLCLLLKVLEGETGQLAWPGACPARSGQEHPVRQLADWAGLLRRPPAIVGFLDEEERYRVNAFNWQAAFPQIFIAGGFDVVIGNPPYVRQRSLSDRKNIFIHTTALMMVLLTFTFTLSKKV